MKCRVCGREIGDEEQFCKYCGAEQKRKRKRLTWAERRRKNEIETKEYIAKASLQKDEVDEAQCESATAVTATRIDSVDGYCRKTIALTAVFAALAVAALAALVLIRYAEMDDTLTVVIAFVLLVVAAYGAASFAERLYAARALTAMRKSGRGIKKIRYAHAPVMICDGAVYRLDVTRKCPVCGADRHIEDFEGRQVIVCNADRGHLAVLDSEGLFALVSGEAAPMQEQTSQAAQDENDARAAAKQDPENADDAKQDPENADDAKQDTKSEDNNLASDGANPEGDGAHSDGKEGEDGAVD